MLSRHWSEDQLALAVGGLVLSLALLGWFMLPWLADTLAWLPVALDNWQLNPLEALTGGALPRFVVLTLVLAGLFGAGMQLAGHSPWPFFKGFLLLSCLALLARLLAAQQEFSDAGLGYALWAIALGLFIANVLGLPSLLKPALQHEFYVKVGLVLLGAEVLFSKVLAIGLPGIFVAWVVTPIVLITTFWFGQRILRIPSKTLNITVSADMSVCGVSAAIATAAACRAKKEELTTAIGMSMVFTSIMMVALPTFIRFVGMPDVLGGAWIGGTIDATGAVVAAGAFLGDTAMNVAATIKMIQNILIGVMAFGVAVYWSSVVEADTARSVQAGEIWRRFPKFILGFVAASITFSALFAWLPEQQAVARIEEGILDVTSSLRGWLFALAFASIGLATNFRELRQQFAGGKPLILYLCGQALNISLTLLMAWLMFYKVFPEVTHAL